MNGCHIPNCETCAAIDRVSREFHIEAGSPLAPKPSRVIPVKGTTIEYGGGPDHLFLIIMVGVFALTGVVFFALAAFGGSQ